MMMNRASSLLVLILFVAFVATSSMALEAESEFDPTGEEMEKREPCCDMCRCTRSIPPQCRCSDVKPYCPSTCKRCVCDPRRMAPPKCQCQDMLEYCHKPCTTAYLDI